MEHNLQYLHGELNCDEILPNSGCPLQQQRTIDSAKYKIVFQTLVNQPRLFPFNVRARLKYRNKEMKTVRASEVVSGVEWELLLRLPWTR